MNRFNKSIASLGLLAAIMLGGFALCLAHDHVPADAAFSFKLRLGAPNGVAQPDDFAPRLRFDLATGEVPPSMQKVPQEARILDTTPRESGRALISPRIHPAKLARHMLDSKLLI